MPSGKLIVLTGPSGVGKGTLVQRLLKQHPQLFLSISATTRLPRPGEIDGKDYYFVGVEKFEDMINKGEFLEWAKFTGNYYGTPQIPVRNRISQGQSVVLEIELEGARQVRNSFPEALSIFILPPSFAELERRLRGRGQDSEEAVQKRLKRAQEEIEAAHEFNFQVINDDLELTLNHLELIIQGS